MKKESAGETLDLTALNLASSGSRSGPLEGREHTIPS
jgi:hypothetical protein